MKFTEYIWDLYKNSIEGGEFIAMFDPEKMDAKEIVEKYSFYYGYELNEEFRQENDIQSTIADFTTIVADFTQGKTIESFEDARNLFEAFVFKEGIPMNFVLTDGQTKIFSYIEPDCNEKDELKCFFDFFEAITVCLYKTYPEYFFPYLFDKKAFHSFIKVCENFEITMPAYPPKNNWYKRVWYYFELSASLHEFRKFVNLTPSEFVAFIYDFGVKSLTKTTKEELSEPSKVWFLGGGEWDYKFLDNSDDNSSATWGAGNERIKQGDILIMYCTMPRKHIHSIWRATSDSFINPFAHYYYVVNIGFPIKINPVGFQTLVVNPVYKNNSTVKANMQGLNGKPVNQEEYLELQRLIKESGMNITDMPNLPCYNHTSEGLQDERDVEEKLVEPLLIRLGFNNNHWMRQMPIRMGRGIRYYPDYAILYNSKRGDESAKIILETKYEILSERQLEDAYLQAKSYAIRLKSNVFIVADKFKLYLFEPIRDTFEISNRRAYTWADLSNPDKFHSFKEKIKK